MSRRARTLLIGGGLLAVGLAVWAWTALSSSQAAEQEHPVAVAQRGPLVISITEAGTVQARDQVVIKSEVEGQTTILYLIPEGARVQRGDLLVELDTSNLQDRLVEQEIQLKNSDTAFIRARENLEVVKKQAESDIALATRDLRFAQEDLKQYIDGEFPKLLNEANSRITLEQEELENSSNKLEWSRMLRDQKYISDSELEADRLARGRASLDHELAVANRDLLQNYTYRRTLDQLQSDIEEAQRALERVELTTRSDIIQAQADLDNKRAELDQQRAKLDKLVDQIAKARIISPANAMVVYASSARSGGWRGNDEPLAEGQQVRERQELIHLPTTDAIMVELKVHESNLDKIVVGLAVRVRVDAIPGKVYNGRISSIAPLPDGQSMWMNPDLKVYRTVVHLENSEEALRTGMSCQCDIYIDHYESTVYVPLQAVVRHQGQPVVYVRAATGFERRTVEIGRDNNRVVVIASGLGEGDVVSLAPPLSAEGGTQSAAAGAEAESIRTQIEAARERQRNASDAGGSLDSARPTAVPGELPGPAGLGDGGRNGSDGAERRRPEGGRMEGRRERPPGAGGETTDRMQNLSPEEREALRERMRNATPEERERMRGARGRRGAEGAGEAGERPPDGNRERPNEGAGERPVDGASDGARVRSSDETRDEARGETREQPSEGAGATPPAPGGAQ